MNKEHRVLWTVLNNAQGMAVKFLINYEAGIIKHSPQIQKWYEESLEEFNILQDFKEKLQNGKQL
jgi:hypothetical protein